MLSDNLDAAAAALTAQKTAIDAERAAILALVPSEASVGDVLAGLAHNVYLSPARLVAALQNAGLQGSALEIALAQFRVPVRQVWLDPAGGNDANTGIDASHPVQGIARAIAMAGAGEYLVVHLMNDLTPTAPIVSNVSLGFIGAGAMRTITLNPGAAGAIGSSSSKAVIQMIGGALWLDFESVNITLGALDGSTIGAIYQGSGNFGWTVGTFTANGGSSAPLLAAGHTVNAVLNSVTLASGYAGKLFAGVSSGGNPNSIYVWRTNVTSA